LSRQKNKGDNYERELAAYINKHTGLDSFRAPLSGGGNLTTHGGADLLGTPNLFIEAKRVERLNFHDALAQAERNQDMSGAHTHAPIVINRRNRMSTGDSLCLLRLDAFLFFYKYYLKNEGIADGEAGARESGGSSDEGLEEVVA